MLAWLKNIFAKRDVAPSRVGDNRVIIVRQAGVTVTPETALTFSAVYRAISYISQTVALLPWGVYENYTPKANDPVHWMLSRRPNPEMSPFDFKRLLTAHALSWGNGYAEIEFNGAGVPVHLWPMHPATVLPMRDEHGELFYRCFNSNGSYVDLPAYKVFHIRNIGSDGIVGYSTIGLAARTIGMGIAAEKFGSNLFERQAIPSGVLETEKQLSEEAATRLQSSFTDAYSGASNAGEVMVLEEGMKFRELTFKPEDLQFIQSRQFSVEEIARWFGLPPHKLSDMSRATFSNIENLSIAVVNDAILPWCKPFEEEGDYKLLSKRRGDVYTKMNIRGLLRGDNASRADYYTKMLQNGVYCINDVRFLEDMPPIEHGDKHFVPLNQTTIENAGKEQPVVEVIETPDNEEPDDGADDTSEE